MDGLINLYKPPGLSSAQALYRVRRLTGQRRSGHGGTLDPCADGVLVLCLGLATRLVEAVMDQPKVYRTTIRLDATSPSLDAETPPVPVAVDRPPDPQQVAAALAGFVGTVLQTPPAASAIKVGGRPAYRLARAGQAVALEPRPVRIYWLHLHDYAWPLVDISLACGRGTYVRGLARDLGARLGTGGTLVALRREAVGPLRVAESWTLERMASVNDPGAYLIPLERARALLAAGAQQVPERPGADGRRAGPRP